MSERIERTGNLVVHHPKPLALAPVGPRLKPDGYAHIRDEHGTCRNCGASKREYHYELVPKPAGLLTKGGIWAADAS